MNPDCPSNEAHARRLEYRPRLFKFRRPNLIECSFCEGTGYTVNEGPHGEVVVPECIPEGFDFVQACGSCSQISTDQAAALQYATDQSWQDDTCEPIGLHSFGGAWSLVAPAHGPFWAVGHE